MHSQWWKLQYQPSYFYILHNNINVCFAFVRLLMRKQVPFYWCVCVCECFGVATINHGAVSFYAHFFSSCLHILMDFTCWVKPLQTENGLRVILYHGYHAVTVFVRGIPMPNRKKLKEMNGIRCTFPVFSILNSVWLRVYRSFHYRLNKRTNVQGNKPRYAQLIHSVLLAFALPLPLAFASCSILKHCTRVRSPYARLCFSTLLFFFLLILRRPHTNSSAVTL